MIKVFLVEDEVVIREGMKKIIPWSEYGYELSGEAGDGELAISLIRKIKPDVVITDIKMPFMDGLTLSKFIRKEFPDTKIVIMSGYDEFEYARQAIYLGVERYILKPIRKKDFIEVLEDIRTKFENENIQKNYYLKFKKEVERLSTLYDSYSKAMKVSATNYLNKEFELIDENSELKNIDVSALNSEFILNFLNNALPEEIDDFVKQYLQKLGERALKSKIFFKYNLLNIYFISVSFIQKLGFDKRELDEYLKIICSENMLNEEDAKNIIKNILKKSINLRQENTQSRYIYNALTFIENNYMNQELSLSSVALKVNVSANHFSALFSQEMKKTFIEYLTELRMKKAKELLSCTDKRSGEIAYEVGYKDPHYFSSLFKKLQGCTPKEYRNKRSKNYESK